MRFCIDENVFVSIGKELRIVFATFFPSETGQKILLTEDFVHHRAEIGDFVLVDADQDYAISVEQSPRQPQARIDHVQPVGVKPSTCLGIFA